MPPDQSLRIGEWVLVPSTHSLSAGGTTHRLPKRLVALLRVLATRPGQTWTREALIEAVWTRKQVNDEVLSRAVAELRGLLGDDAREPRYIETLPKTGYRLLAPVSVVDEGEPQSAPAAMPVDRQGAARARSIRLWPWGLALCGSLALVWWGTERLGQGQPGPAMAPVHAGAWTAADLVREVPFRSGPHWAWQPRYSADGRWLVYVVNDLQAGESWIEWSTADGSAPRRLDSGSGRPAAPVFSPDAARIAFTAWEGGQCALRIMDLPAGLPREVAACGGSRSHPLDWPSARRLLYSGAPSRSEGPSALWQIDPESGAREQVTRPPDTAVLDSHPRDRGDGTLAFLRGPEGLRELWLQEAGVERLILPGAHRIPDLAWSVDGQALVVASDQDGFPGLHWLSLAGGGSRLLGGRGRPRSRWRRTEDCSTSVDAMTPICGPTRGRSTAPERLDPL